jgi:uncharacterized protein YcfJ
MNKLLVRGLVASAVMATAGVALAGYTLRERQSDYAQVVEVKAVEKTIRTPRQECHDDALIQQKHMQDGRTAATAKPRCETVYDTHIERMGYDVRYRIRGQEGKVRMGHDPGKRIPLRSGQLVLDGRTRKG